MESALRQSRDTTRSFTLVPRFTTTTALLTTGRWPWPMSLQEHEQNELANQLESNETTADLGLTPLPQTDSIPQNPQPLLGRLWPAPKRLHPQALLFEYIKHLVRYVRFIELIVWINRSINQSLLTNFYRSIPSKKIQRTVIKKPSH